MRYAALAASYSSEYGVVRNPTSHCLSGFSQVCSQGLGVERSAYLQSWGVGRHAQGPAIGRVEMQLPIILLIETLSRWGKRCSFVLRV
jgi:hypothetical protein